jgi:hypothetical protein
MSSLTSGFTAIPLAGLNFRDYDIRFMLSCYAPTLLVSSTCIGPHYFVAVYLLT